MLEMRTPDDGDVEAMMRLDGRIFGYVWKPEELERQRR